MFTSFEGFAALLITVSFRMRKPLSAPFFFYKLRTFLKIYLFIYFWLRWVFVVARGLSLVAVSGGYSSLQCTGFLLRWLLFVVEHRL